MFKPKLDPFIATVASSADLPGLRETSSRKPAPAVPHHWFEMIIRDLSQLAGTDRDVQGEGWRSRRFLRLDDGVKFSLHLTDIEAGTELELEYANHFEANYCIAGEGEVVDVASGKIHHLSPGTMYTLDQHDKHILRAGSHMTLLCVFWPALVGNESHDSSGGYPRVEGDD